VVDFGDESLFGDSRIEDMFQVNRQHVEESLGSSRADRVRRVIICRPRIRSITSSTVRETIEDTLVGI
jgi:hypothetical protein